MPADIHPPIEHYSVAVHWSDADQEYVATSAEFPALSWLASSPSEAIEGLREVIRQAIEVLIDDGEPIPVPEPVPATTASGQVRLRMPRWLHAQMARMAEAEGVSLNTLAVSYLSSGLARGSKAP